MQSTHPSPRVHPILVVEDDPGLRDLLVDELQDNDYAVEAVGDAEAALDQIGRLRPSLVISDLRLPGRSGTELLEQVRASDRQPPPAFVLITAFGSIPDAVHALKLGADDFLTKPLDLDHLLLRVERILEVEALRREVRAWRQVEREGIFHGIVGKASAMTNLFFQIRKIAHASGSALIMGESGTGKELVAGAIHAEGRGSDAPFVPVNCAGVPESLLESEFFGHAQGAFTGASGPRKGLFQQAHKGTLLLDEVGDLSQGLQAKLLRVLQEGRVRPVGADAPVEVDVRVVAATNRSLEQAVEDGEFREDLFYRLSTFILRVPPLRERRGDINLLASTFLGQVKQRNEHLSHVEGFDEAALELLGRYPFPGNVRELKNLVERAATFCDGPLVTPSQFPDALREFAANAPAPPMDNLALAEHLAADGAYPSLKEMSRRYANFVVEQLDGNKRRAAELLDISRTTLYRYLPDGDSD